VCFFGEQFGVACAEPSSCGGRGKLFHSSLAAYDRHGELHGYGANSRAFGDDDHVDIVGSWDEADGHFEAGDGSVVRSIVAGTKIFGRKLRR
jgi:hypothetical protein